MTGNGPLKRCPEDLWLSSRLGHYDVTALIGEGGMGEELKARVPTP